MEQEQVWQEPNVGPKESQPANPRGDLTYKGSICFTDQETNHQIRRQQPRELLSPPENKAGTQITF